MLIPHSAFDFRNARVEKARVHGFAADGLMVVDQALPVCTPYAGRTRMIFGRIEWHEAGGPIIRP